MLSYRIKMISLVLCLALTASACSDRAQEDKQSSGVGTTTAAAQTTQVQTTEKAPDEQPPADSETTTAQEGITPAMWKIDTKKGHTIYLLGSMHALPDSAYPLPEVITKAYNEAETVAFECDVTNASSIEYQSLLLKAMYNEDGTKLSEIISPEGYKALGEYLESFGMNVSVFDAFRPWAVSNQLDSMAINYTDLKSENGIDNVLLKQTKADGKEVFEIESVEFQMDMLMNFSDELYDLQFRTLEGKSKDDTVKSLEELYEAWAKGDTDKLYEINYSEEQEMSDEDAALAEDYDRQMLTDRNAGMEKAIKDFVEKDDKNVLVVVGSMHYVSDESILELLDRDGIKYERIEY